VAPALTACSTKQPRPAGGEMVAYPYTAEMTAGVIEAGSVAVGIADLPIEDVAVEGRRLTDVGCRDVQVGDRLGSGQASVHAVIGGRCWRGIVPLVHDLLSSGVGAGVAVDDRVPRRRRAVAAVVRSGVSRSRATLSVNHSSKHSGAQPRSGPGA
jgi:hypothetical protein